MAAAASMASGQSTASGAPTATFAASSAQPSVSSAMAAAITSSASAQSASNFIAASAGAPAISSPSISQYSNVDIASGKAFQNVSDTALNNMAYNIDTRGDVACTYDNAAVRTEFRQMSNADRKGLTDAITCLQQLPPQFVTADQANTYPGVKSRHDEYVATHINYTYNIHMTADFLAWHRFFIHSWEADLRGLCGYTGVLPYWNWAEDAEDPSASELFNGDEYSMGSNGEYISGRADTYLGLQNTNFPPGTGGGCVTSGPFKNYTVNMGPIDSPYQNNVAKQYDHNPRCLVRDLNSFFSQKYLTYTNVTELILQNIYIEDFQSLMQGYGSETNKFGVHGAGHWVGGGPSVWEDFHSSPGDPMFFLHHAMIDRIWTIWQNLDTYGRQDVIRGTSTLGNSPPSPEMTLDDMIPFGLVAPDQRLGDLMDTFKAPYCYRYN